jgi:RimJ/RimL family protein N-acetyltransferase
VSIDPTTVELVRFDASSLRGLRRLLEDPEVVRFTRIPEPVPADFAERWLERYEAGRRDGTKEAFTVVDRTSGNFLGVAVVPSIRREERTAELGYVTDPAARGRGVATQALELLTAWAFRELEAVRLELLISSLNVSSKRVAERTGYAYEGTLRSLYVKPGVWEDSEMWSRLATDR